MSPCLGLGNRSVVSGSIPAFFRPIIGYPPFFSTHRFCLGLPQAVHQDVWAEVYRFWKDKRSRLGKPLLRRFWPVTPSNDTDPHKVGGFSGTPYQAFFVFVCVLCVFVFFFPSRLVTLLCFVSRVEYNRCSPRYI